MIEAKYSEAAAQVLDILNYTDKEDVKKIPQSFIKFLTEIANKNYNANFNHNGPMSSLNLKKQTRELLGFMYITWWCNENDRDKFKSIIRSDNLNTKKIGKNEKYNINDIFTNRKETKSNVVAQNVIADETLMIEYKEENIFRKFINKILSFFKNKKERS